MAESIPKLTIGWLKKLGRQVYTVSHAKVCFYGWDLNGKQITVYEKIEAIYRAVMMTRYGKPVNLNDITDQCCMYVTNSDGELLNTPDGSTSGFLKVYDPSSGNFIKQEYLHGGTINSTDYKTYIRTYNKTTKQWGDWAQNITDKTKLISLNRITYGSTTCASSTETYPKNTVTKTTSCYSITNGGVGVKILKPGVYAICARAHFNAQTSTSVGYRRISLMFKKKGETAYSSDGTDKRHTYGKENSVKEMMSSPTMYRRLEAGDYVSPLFQQNNGGSSAIVSAAYLDLTYLGA